MADEAKKPKFGIGRLIGVLVGLSAIAGGIYLHFAGITRCPAPWIVGVIILIACWFGPPPDLEEVSEENSR